jgi:predicted amidohydrolase
MLVVGVVSFVAERKIPVASIQLRAHDLRDFAERLPQIVDVITDAATLGAKLVVVPEGTVPAYVIGGDALLVSDLDRAREHMTRVAREHGVTIVYGTAYIEDGVTYNTGTVVLPDGSIAGRAEKQLLWHFDERWFARGRSLEPIDTPAGRLGVLICADGRLPSLARALVDRGAEILVVPTAWVTSGRDPASLENVQADLMIGVRARENGVPLVAANKVGVELGAVAYCGKSAIVDATGEFVARAGEREETTLFGEVTLGDRRPRRPAVRWEALGEAAAGPRRQAARIGITPERRGAVVDWLTATAALADVDLVIALGAGVEKRGAPTWNCSQEEYHRLRLREGLAVARVGDEAMLDPGALVEPRLRGVDLFVWTPGRATEERWQVAFARTRAAELRAYVVVIDAEVTDRAFAVDPDGTILCGTFDGLRLAQFAYDRARTGATMVVPRTDVLDGLRAVEALK